MHPLPLALVLLGAPAALLAQASQCKPTLAPRTGGGGQVADSSFDPAVLRPAFAAGKGPLVLLDEAHNNFHTVDGRYAPFARLLRKDGYVVRGLKERVSAAALAGARVLVIANAIGAANTGGNWSLPIAAAFDSLEIVTINGWVHGGGSLLLIADHMPFPGATETLASSFGIFFMNGFATDSSCATDVSAYRRGNRTLGDHPITRGRNRSEQIDSVRSFTGQAFRIPAGGQALMTLEPGSVVLMPAVAWAFNDSTPRLPGEGLLQGAALAYGLGRIAVFGEAAMFSAQVSGNPRRPMGMNAPIAAQNPQFLLNVMRWLTGLLPLR
jgi:hypothetical protein